MDYVAIFRLVKVSSTLTNLLKLSSEQFMGWEVSVQILERQSYEMFDDLSSPLPPSYLHLLYVLCVLSVSPGCYQPSPGLPEH